jgi:hypothetical protein
MRAFVDADALIRWLPPSGTSGLFGECLRDVHRNSERVRVRDVRRHGHDDPAGKSPERRHHPAQRIAVVAGHARAFTRQRDGFEVPAKTVTCLLPRRQAL